MRLRATLLEILAAKAGIPDRHGRVFTKKALAEFRRRLSTLRSPSNLAAYS